MQAIWLTTLLAVLAAAVPLNTSKRESSLAHSSGKRSLVGSIGSQTNGLNIGKALQGDIGKIPVVDKVVDGSSLVTVGGTAGSATSGAKGGLSSVKVGVNILGDETDVAKGLD